MEQMTEEQFQLWIRQHGGEAGRAHNYRTNQAHDEYGRPMGEATREIDSTTIVAKDGAKITVARTPDSGTPGQPDYEVREKADPPTSRESQRTPDQARADAAQATAAEQANAVRQREQDERDWNQFHPEQGGSGLPETHLERATREAKQREEERQAQQLRDQEAQQARASKAQEDANQLAQQRETREAGTAAASTEISRGNLTLAQQREAREAAQANRPVPVAADTKAPYNVTYNPATQSYDSVANPNYDAAKAAAEEKRAELASQIAARQITLEEAKQSYTQWFDTNVKTPLMMAQEQRARAEERRQALDAEERRRQFAADFGLRKASLGQQAAATAIQAEESLLPYRAGPNEAAHMSDAINGLAAGGIIGGPSAGAGIHFQGEDFQFNAPDFKKIAAEATKQVLSGLTDYRPSSDKYSVADYSGIPSVNLGSIPAYSYGGGGGLPAPSPGADQPTG